MGEGVPSFGVVFPSFESFFFSGNAIPRYYHGEIWDSVERERRECAFHVEKPAATLGLAKPPRYRVDSVFDLEDTPGD
jgi:hypothetical protein